MHGLRFNIASALAAVLFVAVGFAALREADALWDSWLFSLTLGFLLFAVLLAVHRSGDRRAFWIGFALFGWGYLGFSLIPSTEPRLITTKALAYLQANILGCRAYGMRAILSLDRMRACNLSDDDVRMALRESSMKGSPMELGGMTDQKSMTVVEHVLTWRARYNKPEQYENIVLKASPDGEVVRLKDVASVELGTSFYIPGFWAGTAETFTGIGHSLVALLAAWLGGVLSRRLGLGIGRVSVAPEVQAERPPCRDQVAHALPGLADRSGPAGPLSPSRLGRVSWGGRVASCDAERSIASRGVGHHENDHVVSPH